MDTKIIVKYTGAAKAPEYKSKGAHCADVYLEEDVTIFPGEIVIAKTGLHTEIPAGYGARLLERSSMPVGSRVTVKAGTIDSDYRNEWGVVLYKLPGITMINALKIGIEKTKTQALNDSGAIGLYKRWKSIFKRAVDEYIISNRPMTYHKGDRIAQVKFEPTVHVEFQRNGELSKSERNLGGFGSTGK